MVAIALSLLFVMGLFPQLRCAVSFWSQTAAKLPALRWALWLAQLLTLELVEKQVLQVTR